MKYRCSFKLRPWYFGFTLWRFSLFAAWKSDATMRNYFDALQRDGFAEPDGGDVDTVRHARLSVGPRVGEGRE